MQQLKCEGCLYPYQPLSIARFNTAQDSNPGPLSRESEAVYPRRMQGVYCCPGRVDEVDSVFYYTPPTSYSTYASTGFQPLFVEDVLANMTDSQRLKAKETCGDNKECLFDFVVTGKCVIYGLVVMLAVSNVLTCITAALCCRCNISPYVCLRVCLCVCMRVCVCVHVCARACMCAQ